MSTVLKIPPWSIWPDWLIALGDKSLVRRAVPHPMAPGDVFGEGEGVVFCMLTDREAAVVIGPATIGGPQFAGARPALIRNRIGVLPR